jgi:two-component system chemotaxis response regulator CheY
VPVAADMQVMVVDDQRAMRNLVRTSLNELGCRHVVECADGREALKALIANPVHLVISDMNMPGMDGLALLRAMRAQPNLAGIGFIMLTSRGDAELVREAISYGVNNYVIKPFTMAILRRKIEAVFGPLT